MPLRRVAEVAGAICDLPAVPTLDWCDRAAACLCLAGPRATSVLLVGSVHADGRVLTREAVGVAISGVAGGRAEDAALTALRSRAHRLGALGLSPPCGDQPWVLPLAADPDSPVGQLLAGQPPGQIIAAAAALPNDGARQLIAIIASPSPGAETGAVLEATFPLLAARAGSCLGSAQEQSWLTLREQEVLEQLTLGKSVRQIAQALGRSPHTVHDHVKSLHRKLSARTRGELIARALGHLPRQHPGPRLAAQLEPKAPLRLEAGVPLTRAG
jgi:DNA-binding CsgD family transcriptional regulator